MWPVNILPRQDEHSDLMNFMFLNLVNMCVCVSLKREREVNHLLYVLLTFEEFW
jgi:hypothetical protein